MTPIQEHDAAGFLAFFPFLFAGVWLVATSVLAIMSGWYGLRKHYPANDETPLLKLGMRSGVMGLGVNMSGVLTFSACPTGLRVAIWPLFGPFSRPFQVPWGELEAEPLTRFMFRRVKLRLGSPPTGSLTIAEDDWERLSSARGGQVGGFVAAPAEPTEANRRLATQLALEWALTSGIAAAFFTVAPRLIAPDAEAPPVATMILVPTVAFGFVALIRYLIRRRRS